MILRAGKGVYAHTPRATRQRSPRKTVSIGRHEANCTICAHAEREAIERDFVAWRSPVAITVEYGLTDRATVYRHAQALNLFTKRQRNVRAALERLI